MRKNLSKQKEKGITLVALVVTIVVLMILAGVSIGVLKGDGGIIKQAGEAKIETEKSEIKEQIDIMTVQSIDKVGNIDREILKEKLEKLKEGKEIVETENIIYVIYPQYSFEINLSTGDVGEEIIEKITDETPWELSGVGTEENPYLIESIEDLVAFSNSVNSGKNYSGKYIKLSRTLDFNSPFSYHNYKTKVSETSNRIIEKDDNGLEIKMLLTTGTGFNPIGGKNGANACWVNFDGNGKEIKNIYINRSSEEYVGLFGYTLGGTIKNIKLSGNIVGKKHVGGIAGQCDNVENACNFAKIKGENYVGGVVGRDQITQSVIQNCYNVAEITGNENVGGIKGIAYGNTNNCYNIGTIKCEIVGEAIGGIIGYNYNYTDIKARTIENCYNIGKIEAAESEGVGGIIGKSIEDSTLNLKKCYNSGFICGKSKIGGILGTISSFNGYTYELIIQECNYLADSASTGCYIADIANQIKAKAQVEMPTILDIIQNQIEIDGQTMNVWKEDTNNINNGYPILYWQ